MAGGEGVRPVNHEHPFVCNRHRKSRPAGPLFPDPSFTDVSTPVVLPGAEEGPWRRQTSVVGRRAPSSPERKEGFSG